MISFHSYAKKSIIRKESKKEQYEKTNMGDKKVGGDLEKNKESNICQHLSKF